MIENRLEQILTKLNKVQSELEDEFDRIYEEKKEEFQYSIEQRKVKFKSKVLDFHRQNKKGILKFLYDAELKHIASAPIIYSVIFPLVLLDVFVTVYQHICFRLYGISIVKRKDYIVIDRKQLAYLNFIEKVNCTYCGYGNGLISYVREVIARTEQYWCPIKHANKVLDAHRLSKDFIDYGDVEAYRNNLKAMREMLATLEQDNSEDVSREVTA